MEGENVSKPLIFQMLTYTAYINKIVTNEMSSMFQHSHVFAISVCF